MGRRPEARVRLPGGEVVVGWTAAAARAGRSAKALARRAVRGDDGVWTVRELRRPIAGPGRPKSTGRARIRLPGGEVVVGWDTAAARLGRVSTSSLRERAALGDDGVYALDLTNRRRSAVTDELIRAAVGDAVRAGAQSRAAIVRAVRGRYPRVDEGRVRAIINADTGAARYARLGATASRREPAPCIVDGCGQPAHARGLCRQHYNRWFTRGRRSS